TGSISSTGRTSRYAAGNSSSVHLEKRTSDPHPAQTTPFIRSAVSSLRIAMRPRQIGQVFIPCNLPSLIQQCQCLPIITKRPLVCRSVRIIAEMVQPEPYMVDVFIRLEHPDPLRIAVRR